MGRQINTQGDIAETKNRQHTLRVVPNKKNPRKKNHREIFSGSADFLVPHKRQKQNKTRGKRCVVPHKIKEKEKKN